MIYHVTSTIGQPLPKNNNHSVFNCYNLIPFISRVHVVLKVFSTVICTDCHLPVPSKI